MGFPQQTGYFLPAPMPQPQRFFGQPQRFFGQPQSMGGPADARWAQQPRMAAGQPGLLQQPIRGGRGKPQQMRPTMAPMMAPRPGMHPMPPAAAAAAAAAAGMRPNFKYTPGVRNVAAPMAAAPTPVMAQPPQPQPAVFIQGQEPLTASMLAQAPPSEQKQMLGERLFPLIQQWHPELAGKITGKFLNAIMVIFLYKEPKNNFVLIYDESSTGDSFSHRAQTLWFQLVNHVDSPTEIFLN